MFVKLCKSYKFCGTGILVWSLCLSAFVALTMFLKKLLNKNDVKPEQRSAPPAGMQTMGPSLQKRFAKGVQYNSESECV